MAHAIIVGEVLKDLLLPGLSRYVAEFVTQDWRVGQHVCVKSEQNAYFLTRIHSLDGWNHAVVAGCIPHSTWQDLYPFCTECFWKTSKCVMHRVPCGMMGCEGCCFPVDQCFTRVDKEDGGSFLCIARTFDEEGRIWRVRRRCVDIIRECKIGLAFTVAPKCTC